MFWYSLREGHNRIQCSSLFPDWMMKVWKSKEKTGQTYHMERTDRPCSAGREDRDVKPCPAGKKRRGVKLCPADREDRDVKLCQAAKKCRGVKLCPADRAVLRREILMLPAAGIPDIWKMTMKSLILLKTGSGSLSEFGGTGQGQSVDEIKDGEC